MPGVNENHFQLYNIINKQFIKYWKLDCSLKNTTLKGEINRV